MSVVILDAVLRPSVSMDAKNGGFRVTVLTTSSEGCRCGFSLRGLSKVNCVLDNRVNFVEAVLIEQSKHETIESKPTAPAPKRYSILLCNAKVTCEVLTLYAAATNLVVVQVKSITDSLYYLAICHEIMLGCPWSWEIWHCAKGSSNRDFDVLYRNVVWCLGG